MRVIQKDMEKNDRRTQYIVGKPAIRSTPGYTLYGHCKIKIKEVNHIITNVLLTYQKAKASNFFIKPIYLMVRGVLCKIDRHFYLTDCVAIRNKPSFLRKQESSKVICG
jgi:hypothetical protein